MSVELGLVTEPNPGQNSAENTSEVEQLAIDELEGATAVLLVPAGGQLGVVQTDGLLAHYLLAGGFAQFDPVLQKEGSFKNGKIEKQFSPKITEFKTVQQHRKR